MRLVAMLIAASAVSLAADQRGQGPPLEGGMSQLEVQKIFDGYVLVQVQDALGLSEQQFAQVVPRLRALQETRRRYHQERGRLLLELQRLTRGGMRSGGDGEAPIKERLAKLQENEARFAEDQRRAYSDLDEVLDVRQQGRFRVFEEQIERKKLDLLLRARQNRPMQRRQPPDR